jgi:hypothetical protein
MIGAPIIAAMFLAQAAPEAVPAAPAVPTGQPPASSTVSPVEVQGQKSISTRREVNLAEITCHDELPPGTRFKVKVCATNRQFLERTQDSQATVRDWQKATITSKQQ